jgi:hypothetical protein
LFYFDLLDENSFNIPKTEVSISILFALLRMLGSISDSSNVTTPSFSLSELITLNALSKNTTEKTVKTSMQQAMTPRNNVFSSMAILHLDVRRF